MSGCEGYAWRVRIVHAGTARSTVELTPAELEIISNALDAVCDGSRIVSDEEIRARVGVDRASAMALLAEIQALLKDVPVHHGT
jgi:hypothetical protein